METMILTGQTVLLGLLAGWLVLGALENIRAPRVNGDFVTMVLNMEQMAEERPEMFAQLSGNRLTSPALQRLLFQAIVAVECLVALVLVAGTAALAGALLGLVDPGLARLLAGWGALAYTAIWGAFLVGGQWFHYWVVHDSAQNTHYHMTVWGTVTWLAMVLPA
ncbi:MAG: DUF2165 family protein [Pseudomonadota bacterium]